MTWKIIKETDQSQDQEQSHPWAELTFNNIMESILDYREEYPEYKDFRWEFCWKAFGYGAMNYWWELQGLE